MSDPSTKRGRWAARGRICGIPRLAIAEMCDRTDSTANLDAVLCAPAEAP